ncbi:hypothetical protein Q5P01_003016 [Channa striata]|uniref:Ig-like domain-containing protein n=1 Tax=Channa striata TaxID=64152 RepID=A0AA88P299_CHASR|nr:hypothetical protein Q5P01_003016 [Channa striata]
MSNDASAWILFVCLLSSHLPSTSASEDVKVEGEPGENVVLQCHGTGDVTFLTWSKPDLKSDYFVYFFRNKQLDKDYQLQSFQDRVELKDPNMRNGDASIILKNISISDTGSYECYVGYGGSSELVSRVTLTVRPPGGGAGHTEEGGDKGGGDKDGHVGLVVGLSVVGVLLLAAGITGGFVMFKKHKGRSTY